MSKKTVNVIIKKVIPPHKVGDVVKIPVDDRGIPTDRGWRRRLRDSKIDNCIEIKEIREIPEKQTGKKSLKKTKVLKED